MVAQFVRGDHRDWDQYLPEFRFAMNSAVHDSTSFSPALLNLGRELKFPNPTYGSSLLSKEGPSEETQKEWYSEHQLKLKKLKEKVQKNLANAFNRQAKYYNLRRREEKFEIGQQVLRRQHVLSSAADAISGKLMPKFAGPYTVSKRLGANMYELRNEQDQKGSKHWPIGGFKREEMAYLQSLENLKQLRGPLLPHDDSFRRILNPDKEFDDLAISSYLRLIERRSLINPCLPKIWAFDSFFYVAWQQGKYERVAKWTKEQNILNKDFILFPIHSPKENHWYLIVAEPKRFRIRSFDSLGRKRPVEVESIFEYLKCFAQSRQLPFEEEFWLFEKYVPCVKQANGTNHCGAYVCFYAEQISQNLPVPEEGFDPIEYRKKISTVLRRSVHLNRTDFTGAEWEQSLFEKPDISMFLPGSSSSPPSDRPPNWHLQSQDTELSLCLYAGLDILIDALNVETPQTEDTVRQKGTTSKTVISQGSGEKYSQTDTMNWVVVGLPLATEPAPPVLTSTFSE